MFRIQGSGLKVYGVVIRCNSRIIGIQGDPDIKIISTIPISSLVLGGGGPPNAGKI